MSRYTEMSEVKSKNSKKIKMPVQESEASDVSDNDDIIEITKPKRGKKEVAPPSEEVLKARRERQIESMNKARAAKNENLRVKREQEEKNKQLIEKVYKAELEQELVKTELPKYSKAIKKEILTKLKQQKIDQLKAKYGYKTDSDSDSDSSSEEEEEVVVKKSKKPVKKEVKIKEPVVAPMAKKGLLQTFRDYGF